MNLNRLNRWVFAWRQNTRPITSAFPGVDGIYADFEFIPCSACHSQIDGVGDATVDHVHFGSADNGAKGALCEAKTSKAYGQHQQ